MIENDGEYREAEHETVKPLGEMSRDEIVEKIGKTAALSGWAGAGFPTRVKTFTERTGKDRSYYRQLRGV